MEVVEKEGFPLQRHFNGKEVTLLGKTKEIGDAAPDFKALDRDMQEVRLADFDEPYIVISAVPSIDTGLCDYQTKMFNRELEGRDDVRVITVSNDLPFAHKRYCEAEGLERITILSDHRDLDFAMNYGTLIEELRLQARSVFVLDAERKIIHREYVAEMTDHPDYEAVKSLFTG